MRKSTLAPRAGALAAVLLFSQLSHAALTIELQSVKPALKTSDDAEFVVTIRNDGARPVRLLKWQIPGETDEASFFEVSRDGKPVLYLGKHYKRGTPTDKDYLSLASGQSISRSIELSTQFDLTATGTYAFSYQPHFVDSKPARSLNGKMDAAEADVAIANSNTVHLWVEGSLQSQVELQLKREESIANAIGIQGVSYSSNCSSSRRSTISSAFNTSKSMASNSLNYLNGSAVGARYTTWFGSYTSSRLSTARSHFSKVYSAMLNQNVVFDCGCTSSAYAYVYPTQPYKVYLCNAFWSAPLSGTDSKGGTIVHELSHFNVVAATDDHAYGQSAAKNLARTNPTRALDNADNHEYFAENTPYQN